MIPIKNHLVQSHEVAKVQGGGTLACTNPTSTMREAPVRQNRTYA